MQFSFALWGFVLLFVLRGHAQRMQMPACMSTCITPFAANHEPDLCTANWMTSVSTCIDHACSTDHNSRGSTVTNTTLTFVPKLQYACIQSYVPGSSNSPAAPVLIVQDGQCAESPYQFLSFLPSYTDLETMRTCQLVLYQESGCLGWQTTLEVTQDVRSGVCSFKSGQSVRLSCVAKQSDNTAAHTYLSALCKVQATAAPTPLIMSNSSIAATATNSTNAFTIGGGHAAGAGNSMIAVPTANATTYHMTATPTVGVTTTETGFSKAERAARRGNTAQWALVAAVFARSVLY